ncbi:oxidoreductase [Aquimarina sp. 2201CG14-23]|uniref:oxidoreductase n=1 Tax=Aquimarina mycalae TaxID=3040073 RepID=UPI002477DCEC|nr:oxidoreductase [Aquimarina sp. 2201CG14-23]MDH7446423.1 oxidoreductase [Aquimarina sp. 2201CG14-23]
MAKVVLITGASSGIGKESAKLLLKKGYVVYGSARRTEKMKDIEELGVKLLAMDVTKDDSMTEGIQTIINQEGHIDILVNNAGYGSYGSLEDVPMDEAKYQFEVNVFGLARLTQLVLPYMRTQNSGKIINISSIGGKIGEPHGSWYHATKFAVEGLSDSIRMELKQFGIDVVVIQPGAIKTEWNKIARENLAKVSGNTAYSTLAQKHVKLLEKADDKYGSEPIVIAKTIAKAIEAKKPKTRYVSGGGGKLILRIRKMVSDRMFDAIMLNQMKKL